MIRLLLFSTFILCFGFIKGQDFYDLPLQSQITHTQPYTGLVFWADNGDARDQLTDEIQLEFSYLTFDQAGNNQGQFDWTEVEGILDDIASRSHQAVLRFRLTYPGETDPSVPNFVEQASDYTSTIAKVEGQNTYLPDWTSATLRDFVSAFFQAFAVQFDGDPRLAYLQVGFGSYAEYHLYDGPLQMGQNFPTKAYQAALWANLEDWFSITPWSMSIDAASDQYGPFHGELGPDEVKFGLFDDSFLHEEHSNSDDEYNRTSWLFFGQDRWMQSPAGGELNYYSNHDQKHALTLPNGPHGTSFEQLAEQYHISYMIGNDQLEHQSVERIAQASEFLGYAFQVVSYQTNGVTTKVIAKNNGIAPLYYDAYWELDGVQSQESLKGLLPGQELTFTIPASNTSASLSISCPTCVSGQSIEFDAQLSAQSTGIRELQKMPGQQGGPSFDLLGREVD